MVRSRLLGIEARGCQTPSGSVVSSQTLARPLGPAASTNPDLYFHGTRLQPGCSLAGFATEPEGKHDRITDVSLTPPNTTVDGAQAIFVRVEWFSFFNVQLKERRFPPMYLHSCPESHVHVHFVPPPPRHGYLCQLQAELKDPFGFEIPSLH